VQILDELTIPRPCIDATNVGYNVEWSQELRLEQSLREYVGAAMLIEILKAAGIPDGAPAAKLETLFDMSVGYGLEGIRSDRVTGWIRSMRDATKVVDELRGRLTGPLAKWRDLPFPSRISDAITLSTFHGCPAGEIEGIVTYLLTDLDVDVCIKLNPTLLGRAEVDHLLHDVMGYHDVQTTAEAFDKDLQFADAVAMIPRLQAVARTRGRRLAVKCSNTLVVKNHRTFFTDEVMYLSGPPLHVVTMNLVRKLRAALGATVPVSFSAGLDAHNVANAVAMNLVPTTTCTDLLRPGGYGRLPRYVAALEARMRELGVTRVPDLVLRHAGQALGAVREVVAQLDAAIGAAAGELESGAADRERRWLHEHCERRLAAWAEAGAGAEPLDAVCARLAEDFERHVAPTLPPAVAAPCRSRLAGLEQSLVDEAGVLNTPAIVERTTADPRYGWEKNKGVPRKIGSKLWLYDCVNCDKCVPVCPNDANFVYEGKAMAVPFEDVEIDAKGRWRALPGEEEFVIGESHQLANYADACNDCGNCDVFCPEDGGPQVQKPRFFGSLESYRKSAGRNGFFLEQAGPRRTLHGTIDGRPYRLELDPAGGRAVFHDGVAVTDIALEGNAVLDCRLVDAEDPPQMHRVEIRRYLTLRHLAEAVADPGHVHFVNVTDL
ncbi:MAG TPA: 4Fe-4S dicluster domain-containing protein, partial [Gemmatimonadales bacterium]|nr:4Fe-4S dicluster domain-containing protein [Gemmatimonadales bacterium]